MALLDLSPIEFMQGLFSSVIVFISLLTGLLIALRYFQTKKLTFLSIGFAWSGIIAGWIPDSINFFLVILNQPKLPIAIYLMIAVGLYPPILLLWLIGITELLHIKKRKLYLIGFLIFLIISEILFFTFLIIDISGLLGEYISIFIVDYKVFSIFILFFSLIVIIITGFKFSYSAFEAIDSKVKLKGKLLLFAFISVSIGVVLDLILTALSQNVGTILYFVLPGLIVITRLIIALSSIAFYCGFILPKWIKVFFLKEH